MKEYKRKGVSGTSLLWLGATLTLTYNLFLGDKTLFDGWGDLFSILLLPILAYLFYKLITQQGASKRVVVSLVLAMIFSIGMYILMYIDRQYEFLFAAVGYIALIAITIFSLMRDKYVNK